jgi:hypothetical protein
MLEGRDLFLGRSSVGRPKCTRLAVDERDGASRVPFGGYWAAFQKEESPRTGIPIHDSGPRGLGIRILIPPPTLEAGWLVLGCRPPQAPEGPGLGPGPRPVNTAVTAMPSSATATG